MSEGESRCQNCDWEGPDTETKPIEDIFERVAPGEPMPTGECPQCGALCQPLDVWSGREFRTWAEDVETNMLPKVRESSCSVTLWHVEPDAKLMVETGAAVCLDKPIILVVMPGAPVPAKMRKVADEIIEAEDVMAPDGAEKIMTAVRRVLGPESDDGD